MSLPACPHTSCPRESTCLSLPRRSRGHQDRLPSFHGLSRRPSRLRTPKSPPLGFQWTRPRGCTPASAPLIPLPSHRPLGILRQAGGRRWVTDSMAASGVPASSLLPSSFLLYFPSFPSHLQTVLERVPAHRLQPDRPGSNPRPTAWCPWAGHFSSRCPVSWSGDRLLVSRATGHTAGRRRLRPRFILVNTLCVPVVCQPLGGLMFICE